MNRDFDQNTTREIESLIKSTNDAETRAVLMVLLRVAVVLDDTMRNNEKVSARLQELDGTLSKRVNELSDSKKFGSGFVKGVATIWIILQGIVGYVAYDVVQSVKHNRESIIRLEERIDRGDR